MAQSSGIVLEAVAVDFVRAHRFLLHEVSLTVRQGEHWVLIGPNGAGKTTLLRLLGALEHPTAGQVRVLGAELGKVDMRQLRTAIGHVDPRHPLQRPLSVREVVLSGATNTVGLQQRWKPSPAQLQQADELIEVLGMSPLREARWTTLSSGERGRALIARALMPDPALLLLDEPATGLDLAAREQLLTGLDTLRAGHPRLASVLVTHHLEEIPVEHDPCGAAAGRRGVRAGSGHRGRHERADQRVLRPPGADRARRRAVDRASRARIGT